MLKKTIITFLILCFIGLVAFIFLYLKNQSPEKSVNLFDAVPQHSSFVVYTDQYSYIPGTFQSKNVVVDELSLIESVSQIRAYIRKIDSVILLRNTLSFVQKNSFCVSAHMLGSKNYEYLFLLELTNDFQIDEIAGLSKVFSQNGYSVQKRSYEENIIFDISNHSQTDPLRLSASVSNNMLIFSPSSILVENAIRQLRHGHSLSKDDDFKKLQKTAGKNVSFNLYINHKNFPTLLSMYVSDDYKGMLQNENRVGNWTVLDVNIKKNAVLYNGFTIANDRENYLNLFVTQEPIQFNTHVVMPASTSTYLLLGVSDNELFFKDFEAFLKKKELFDKREKRIKELNEVFGVRVDGLFKDITKNEFGIIYTEVNNSNIADYTFGIVNTKSKRLTEERIKEIINYSSAKTNTNPNKYIHNYKIDDEIIFRIYELAESDVLTTVYGDIYENFRGQYCTFVDNYLLFGNSMKSLAKFLHNVLLKKTLVHDKNFQSFQNAIMDNFNVYFYSNISASYNLYPHYLNKDMQSDLQANSDVLQKFQAIAIQLGKRGDMLYTSAFLQYNPLEENKHRTVWESYLDTVSNFKPVFVKTHRSKDKLIFIQDDKNTVYLLNKTGRIIMKKAIKESINSDVFQIDFYKNGKIQYAFSTRHYLYIVDLLGNFVENYPIKLPYPSTAGMSVFDYDDNRNYRIIIPCQDKRVYLYDNAGNVLEGWLFTKTDTYVTAPIQHIRIDLTDYIVFKDDYNVFILNRRGETKVQVKEKFEMSRKNELIFERAKGDIKHRLITTTADGTVKYIYIDDGSVETALTVNVSPQHYFNASDINSDGIYDYIFVDSDELKVVNKDNAVLYTYDFENKIHVAPFLYEFSASDIKVGIVDKDGDKIYLINKNGSLYSGFPVKGKTRFSIGFLNRQKISFNLIVGSGDNFLYNYDVK